MASVSSPTLPHTRYKKNQNPRISNPSKFLSPTTRHSTYPILYYVPVFSNTHNNRVSSPSICRCNKNSDSPLDDNVDRRWKLEDMVKNVMTRIENYLNSSQKRDDEKSVELEAKEEKLKEEESNGSGEWDWERWKKHFEEVDEQEKIVSVLKSQLGKAVHREEYEYASKLKVAVAAAATNDIVGRVFNQFNRAIEEERYQDAAFLRDHAGAGLMGWWAGIPEDLDDPYGRIIHIGVEHGRYVARSFSPRHLATASPGVPLFEIFLTLGPEGEYKQQAVYLKRNGRKFDGLTNLSKSLDPSSKISQLNGSDDVKSQGSDDVKGQQSPNSEDTDDKDDDSDVAEGLAGVQNILRDIDPDAKVTVLEVSAPGKVSKDLILNVIEQYLDTEDEEDADNVADEQEEIDEDFESLETDEDDVKAESSQDEGELYTGDEESGSDIENERSEMEINVEIEDQDEGSDNDNGKEPSDMQIKVVIGGRLQTLASDAHAKSLLRVPARLEKKNRLSFSFSIEDDDKELEASNKEHVPHNKTLLGRQSIHNVMSDLAKYAIKREKIPMKVLKGVEDFISLTLNQAKNRQPLAGTTKFNRIEIPASSDILNGLYIGAHGLYTPEVIHLSRKFGNWQEDGPDNKLSDIEFYEYVEAVKLTGDPYVPAGQIAFRAKVGKQYQLPHKGIIPEEFGVVARYKGQGRLAEPGFKNPRWVDGELVILNGKYIKGGPVVGFVYWAPDYQFLVFFNRLRLPK